MLVALSSAPGIGPFVALPVAAAGANPGPSRESPFLLRK